MGSRTHCSKTDGFPGTHGTHANEATAFHHLNFLKIFHKTFTINNKILPSKALFIIEPF